MEDDCVDTVRKWPVPKSHRDIQVFLGFANFYRRFIHRFSAITRPLSSLLEGGKNGKFSGPFTMTDDALKAFDALKDAFCSAPLLTHFDPERPSRLETNASGKAITGIISQPKGNPLAPIKDQSRVGGDATGGFLEDKSQMHWHPVAFWSRKMTPAERNYDTGDTELLAIVMSCKHWRHYLEDTKHPVTIITDYLNLRSIMIDKVLSRRQAR